MKYRIKRINIMLFDEDSEEQRPANKSQVEKMQILMQQKKIHQTKPHDASFFEAAAR